ncbi:MAG: TonB-dependent receptor domain-containing protein, partial [Gemmatimonadota bacterium]
PAGEHTVRIQLIGYATQEQQVTVQAGGTATANFEMGLSAIALDELVVTGQGRAREQRELGTQVDVVNAAELQLSPAVSVDQLLQGRVAGGTVKATSAQPGTAGLINFRGVSSVFGAQTPVIYVDGVRVDNDMTTALGTGGEQTSALADLLAADIDRIEITKGGAASTLYGSDAATGVIQIFTKRGSPGEARVTMRVEQGFDQPEMKYILGAGKIWDGILPEEELNPNFLEDEYFKTGHYQNYYLGVSGGTSDFTYNVSGRISDGDGVQPKNENQLFAMRGGIQASVTDNLELNFSGNYTRSQFGRVYNGIAIADPITALEVGDALWLSDASTLEDALGQFLMPDIDEQVNRFIFSSALNYQPSDMFEGRISVGLDNRSSLNRIYEPIGWIVASSSGGQGAVYRYTRAFNSVSMEAAGSVTFPETDTYTNTFTFGVQGFRDDIAAGYSEGLSFALPGAPEVDEAGEITASESNSEVFNGGLFFEDQIGLWDRFFINAGVRLDANTTFGDQVEAAAYPKFTASYLLSDEPFFRDLAGSVLNDVKLRVAYGKTGKFPPPFLRDRTYSATAFRGQSAPRFDNPGNPDLGPEVTSTIEAGVDLAFLENRFGLNVTWYSATTDDALFRVPEPPVTGLGTQVRNVGEISNVGWELEGSAQIVNTRAVQWNVQATYNTVDNRITDMGAAAPFWIGGTYQRVCGPPNDCVPEADGLEELPVGAWLVDTPIDTNGDGLLDDTDQFFLCNDGTLGSEACDIYASPVPRYSGNVGTDVTLMERLTISALADWAAGFWVHDWGSMWATYNGIYRREIVDSDYEYPTLHDGDGNELGPYGPYSAISEFLYDGDYVKLRELAARYAVPADWST